MLSADELAEIRADAAATMDSACVLVDPTEVTGDDGEVVISYDFEAGEVSICGFRESTSRTQYLADGTLIEADAVARLPYGTAVAAGWGLRLTTRLGTSLAPPTDFVVMGESAGATAAVVVALRRVA